MRTHRTRAIGLALLALLTFSALAGAQTWTALTHQPSVPLGTSLLLTDGTVMSQQMLATGYATGQWWRLTPDNTGSYVNGTWTQLASMPSGYSPLYYGSAVLPDGRVVVEGGEYNGTSQAETNLGAIYNPATNAWTSITAPSGWTHIGDAQSAVLANGTFMLGNCGYAGSICSPFQLQQALLNATSLTWTITGSGKADQNSEEGWVLLPNGDLLAVDVWNGTESELYNSSTGTWSLAGSTVVKLPNTTCSEIGPAVLRPEGSVFATGGTSSTAIYSTSTGTWSAGPTFPSGLGVNDGPAAILPDGNVLVDTAPISPCYATGSKFFEFNGTSVTAVSGPPRAGSDASYVGRMLVLPTGQILFTDGSASAEVYTATGTYQSAWQPTISSVASTLNVGSTSNVIDGTQFNGLSQGAMYGDDAQMATNYPLVRIANNSTGHVFYCKTHNHSTMGVATGSTTVSTEFDIPSTIETGASTLAVVANGIPSTPVNISVAAPVFTFTGSMNTARDNHTATLLQNGSVLVAGGYGAAGYLSSAELYNPATGTFTVTGSMSHARLAHTATLLQNGLVLVTGGYYNGNYLSSAELYNPATGTFTPTGSMNATREAHTATLLNNGMVLITGGYGNAYLSSAELYNPATGTFTLTGSMNAARDFLTATRLQNGLVLIAGGYNGNNNTLSSAELYNPATGTFTLTGSMNTARYAHLATLLNNGMVLIAGGVNGTTSLSSAELYNPATGTFTVTGSMSVAREGHASTLLQNGLVLITGGYDVGTASALSSAELYNSATGTFSLTGSMNTGRYNHTETLLQNGLALVAGGVNSGAVVSSAELYH